MVKFLIIRLSSIGDIVLTTPVVRCLKNQVEDCRIHYLTKSAYKELLVDNCYISKIHLFEGNLNQTIKELITENFDYVIDLHNNFRTVMIKIRLGVLSFTQIN